MCESLQACIGSVSHVRKEQQWDRASRSRPSACGRSSATAETLGSSPLSVVHTPHVLAVSPAPHTCMGRRQKSAPTPGSRQCRLRHAGDQSTMASTHVVRSVPGQSPQHNTHTQCVADLSARLTSTTHIQHLPQDATSPRRVRSTPCPLHTAHNHGEAAVARRGLSNPQQHADLCLCQLP